MINLNWKKASYEDYRTRVCGPGLYVIEERINSTSYIMYVGKSNDLNGRLYDHLGPSGDLLDCLLPNNVIIHYANVYPEGLRSDLEYYLFKKYSPLLNEIEPPHNLERSCNLPN